MTIAIITEAGVRKVAPLVVVAQQAAAAAALYAQIASTVADGHIYSSYAAGNAATVAGQFFFVAASGAYDLYVHGTATPAAKLPTLDVSTGFLGINVSPLVRLHAKSSAEIARFETTTARGGGSAFVSIYDPSGRKAYIAYADVNDVFYLMNEMNAAMVLGTNAAGRWQITAAGNLEPIGDNTKDAGSASARIKTIHLVNSPSVTSDEREKDWRGAPTEAELRAAKRIANELGFYQWTVEPGGPLRFGARAQKVRDILADEGLLDDNPARYGLLGHFEWVDEASGDPRDRYSLDPDQLSLFLIAAQEARLSALETLISEGI